MKRKQVTLTFDKNKLTLSERNREDCDYSYLQKQKLEDQLDVIQRKIKDPDDRLACLGMELKRVYTAEEIGIFISGNSDELYRVIFNSAKITNSKITFDDIKNIVPKDRLRETAAVVTKLEKEDTAASGKKKKEPPSARK